MIPLCEKYDVRGDVCVITTVAREMVPPEVSACYYGDEFFFFLGGGGASCKLQCASYLLQLHGR